MAINPTVERVNQLVYLLYPFGGHFLPDFTMFMAKWTIPPTKIQKFPLGQLRVLGKKTSVAVEKIAGSTEKDPVKHFEVPNQEFKEIPYGPYRVGPPR
jgi:hypothetical protein